MDMICKIDPSYHDKVIRSKMDKKMCIHPAYQAVYRTLLGAIIFCNKLSKHLTNHGFIQNKHNMCTYNKMVNGEQVTVQFHVDDLIVLHKDQAVLYNFLDELMSQFGQEDELTENKGLVHKYLGITINYLIVGKVVFTMFNYLEGVIVKATEVLKSSCSYYPGNNQLFKVDEESLRLPPKDAELFLCHFMRLLFASKRARPNIQVYVAFLCT